MKLEIYLGKRISIENTAIFLDEIQKSERVINSLKYFCEAEENYRVIGAGSLLGVKLSRFESSFPVGKVNFLNLYPLNFDEYLLALGEEKLVDLLEKKDIKMIQVFSDKFKSLLREYYYIGCFYSAYSTLSARYS